VRVRVCNPSADLWVRSRGLPLAVCWRRKIVNFIADCSGVFDRCCGPWFFALGLRVSTLKSSGVLYCFVTALLLPLVLRVVAVFCLCL
jgi:hypothetical protein